MPTPPLGNRPACPKWTHCARARPASRRTHAISGAHALLSNIVIAWNTARMQAVVDRWRKEGMDVEDEWLRWLGPVQRSPSSDGAWAARGARPAAGPPARPGPGCQRWLEIGDDQFARRRPMAGLPGVGDRQRANAQAPDPEGPPHLRDVVHADNALPFMDLSSSASAWPRAGPQMLWRCLYGSSQGTSRLWGPGSNGTVNRLKVRVTV
jgi:hypothetical protein